MSEAKGHQKHKVQLDQSQLDARMISEVAELFKTLGDETRLKILNALAVKEELTVESLAEAVGISHSAVSHQLRRLKNQRVVKSRRSGRFVFYSLDDQHMVDLYQLALDHVAELYEK